MSMSVDCSNRIRNDLTNPKIKKQA